MLAHSNVQFLDRTAHVKGDSPFASCNVSFDATVWSPRVGMRLGRSFYLFYTELHIRSIPVGRINLCSPDHVSLLVHRTFNVSIPRRHIPAEQWEFEYGPADNDPEFGIDVTHSEDNEHHGGKWVHHLTRDLLGGAEGVLEFTVIGYGLPSPDLHVCLNLGRLTVANEMLSLLGSVQDDPFSPEHTFDIGNSPQRTAEMEEDETEEEDVLNEDDDRGAESRGRRPKPWAEPQQLVRTQGSMKRSRHEQGLERASSPEMEETRYDGSGEDDELYEFGAFQQPEGVARETVVGERLAQAEAPVKAKKKRKKDSHKDKRKEADNVPKERKSAKKAKRVKVVHSDSISEN
jgi:DNA-directed RNA polymerase I subunit RPA43